MLLFADSWYYHHCTQIRHWPIKGRIHSPDILHYQVTNLIWPDAFAESYYGNYLIASFSLAMGISAWLGSRSLFRKSILYEPWLDQTRDRIRLGMFIFQNVFHSHENEEMPAFWKLQLDLDLCFNANRTKVFEGYLVIGAPSSKLTCLYVCHCNWQNCRKCERL